MKCNYSHIIKYAYPSFFNETDSFLSGKVKICTCRCGKMRGGVTEEKNGGKVIGGGGGNYNTFVANRKPKLEMTGRQRRMVHDIQNGMIGIISDNMLKTIKEQVKKQILFSGM